MFNSLINITIKIYKIFSFVMEQFITSLWFLFIIIIMFFVFRTLINCFIYAPRIILIAWRIRKHLKKLDSNNKLQAKLYIENSISLENNNITFKNIYIEALKSEKILYKEYPK